MQSLCPELSRFSFSLRYSYPQGSFPHLIQFSDRCSLIRETFPDNLKQTLFPYSTLLFFTAHMATSSICWFVEYFPLFSLVGISSMRVETRYVLLTQLLMHIHLWSGFLGSLCDTSLEWEGDSVALLYHVICCIIIIIIMASAQSAWAWRNKLWRDSHHTTGDWSWHGYKEFFLVVETRKGIVGWQKGLNIVAES